MANILELRDVSKIYKNFQLKNITFQIEEGKIVGLIGQNGNGKTTLIKCILNIVEHSGEVKILGVDINEKQIKEYIGVVFDELPFDGILNAKDISVIMKSIYKNWSQEEFNKYLIKFNLEKKQSFNKYSKGMKIKLMLAIALSHGARILILDEPTSGLDPIFRQNILNELKDYVAIKKGAVLFSTHITSDLEQVADDIIYINKGEIIYSGSKEGMLRLQANNKEEKSIDIVMSELLKRIDNESNF